MTQEGKQGQNENLEFPACTLISDYLCIHTHSACYRISHKLGAKTNNTTEGPFLQEITIIMEEEI